MRRLLLLFVTIFISFQPHAEQIMNEEEVIAVVNNIDDYVNSGVMHKLNDLISGDGMFLVKINDIDEENAFIIRGEEYLNNAAGLLDEVDSYSIKRKIQSVKIDHANSTARVNSTAEEIYTINDVEDIGLSSGYLDITLVDGKLVVVGGMVASEKKYKYAIKSCTERCEDIKISLPNLLSLQTDWLDPRYQAITIDNTSRNRNLRRDISLVDQLSAGASIYILFMPPFEDVKDFYSINDKRTLYKLLKDNLTDFYRVQSIEPDDNEVLTDYTRYRNDLWSNDQISNLTLVIPDKSIVIDWNYEDRINIFTPDPLQFEAIKKIASGNKIKFNDYEVGSPYLSLYRLYMSPENINSLREYLEELDLLEENVTSNYDELTEISDYIPILITDKDTSQSIINMALENDLMLVTMQDLTDLIRDRYLGSE